MLHAVILTKAAERQDHLRSFDHCKAMTRQWKENRAFTSSGESSITYHRQMSRIRIRLARPGDSHALADLRYRFRTETGSATETKSRFLRRCTSWMRKRFRSGSSPWRCWVLDDGKQLLGHVCVQLFEKVPNPVTTNRSFMLTSQTFMSSRKCGAMDSERDC